jgi:aspartyl-tRNA(Asn)/glutamyl-tRNA(Gln) amidotransferase subunit A
MYLQDIYTVTCNLAGIPGISVPGGFAPAAEGRPAMPLGIQFCGPVFSEARLLRIARMFESANSYHASRPHMA